MLSSLNISNFALIDELQFELTDSLTIITGETGAGKSILLGALGLVLGNRADLTSLKDTSKKCIIEAEFAIKNYDLKAFFEDENIDYDDQTIIRREILPSGKSRAFINDTPVNLSVLTALNDLLIDIHSQNKTLSITEKTYQFEVLDALANHQPKIESYKRGLILYKKLLKEYDDLISKQQFEKEQFEYHSFLLNELNAAKLIQNEQEELELLLDKLTHIEEIKLNLSEAIQLSENEEIGAENTLKKIKNNLAKISSFSSEYQETFERLDSILIEFNDIFQSLNKAFEQIDVDPSELEHINNRLQLIYMLQKKHQVTSIKELLEVQQRLEIKVQMVENASEFINAKQLEIDKVKEQLELLALSIHEQREKVIPMFTSQLESILHQLGMPNAQFKINLSYAQEFYKNGKSDIEWLFSANKGVTLGELKKIASGGEMSRIMLAVKAVLSNYSHLPTIIFDEIDTGISGEVANKMAEIMLQMAKNMQVITITHLPQIAAKGSNQYKVYKSDVGQKTTTHIKKLSKSERIEELAEMLGGKSISESALEHAKQLLA